MSKKTIIVSIEERIKGNIDVASLKVPGGFICAAGYDEKDPKFKKEYAEYEYGHDLYAVIYDLYNNSNKSILLKNDIDDMHKIISELNNIIKNSYSGNLEYYFKADDDNNYNIQDHINTETITHQNSDMNKISDLLEKIIEELSKNDKSDKKPSYVSEFKGNISGRYA